MSRNDFILASAIAVVFTIFGWGMMHFICQNEPVIVPTDTSKYVRSIDSLNTLNKLNKDSIRVLYKHIQINDSLSLLNLKKLSHDKKVINYFTPDSRKHYLDSMFKSAGL